MLVIVSTIYIVTASPVVALSITRSVVYEYFINRRYNNIFLLSYTIYLELAMINSGGINFVYALRSSRFRQELARFVCFRFLKRKTKDEGLKTKSATVNTTTTGATVPFSSETL